MLNPQSLEPVLDGMDAVIHLVGIISEVGNSTFENVHTRATQNLVTAAQHAGVKRFVHMSALGTRPCAVSRYHQTKWQAEELVRHGGMDFTIFRPSLIYGPHDHFVNLFERMSRFSPVRPVLGSGRARFQPVAVEVVAHAFVRALAESKSIGRTFDLCGPDELTMSQILDEILFVTGRRRLKLRIPIALARVQAAIVEAIFRGLFGKAPPLNRDQLIMLEEDTLGQGRAAEELLGLKQAGFREGIGRYLRRKT